MIYFKCLIKQKKDVNQVKLVLLALCTSNPGRKTVKVINGKVGGCRRILFSTNVVVKTAIVFFVDVYTSPCINVYIVTPMVIYCLLPLTQALLYN